MAERRKQNDIEMSSKSSKKKSLPKYDMPSHKCTDIACTLLFFIFIIALILLSILAYNNGDPSNLVLPHDSQGRICGKTKGYENKKYLLFFDLTKCLSVLSAINGCPTPQICVSECPSFYAYEKIPNDVNKIKQFCDPNNLSLCPTYLLKSQPLYGRCVPEIIANISDTINDIIQLPDSNSNETIPIQAFDENGQISNLSIKTIKKAIEYLKNLINLKKTYELALEDFSKTYWLILIGITLAAILALIWTFLLRFIVKPIVYLSILFLLAILGFMTYFSINEYVSLNKQNQTDFKLEFDIMYNLNYFRKLKETWLAFSIIFGIIFLVLFFVILFLRKRINLAIQMIKEVSKAIIDIPTMLIWPIIPLMFQIGIVVYCVSISLFLSSSGIQLFKIVDLGDSFNTTNRDGSVLNVGDYCVPELFEEIKQSSQNPLYDTYECYYYNFGFNTTLPIGIDSENVRKYYTLAVELINEHQWIPQAFVIFMLFWLTAFTISLNEMTLAGAYASWFFTRYKKFNIKDLPFMIILFSFFRTIFYHIGTLAFGSLIIAIIKMIRIFLEYISEKVNKSESKVANFILKCTKCCFWCLEKFIKFLNRRAFIITSIKSLNFCSSTKEALRLITSNLLRVLVVDKISDFILFLSNLVITFSIGILGFYVFTRKIPVDYLLQITPELNFYVVPLVILIFGSYCVSRLFFDVFDFGIDSLLLCALIDDEENDGTNERPYFASKSLRKILK